MFHFVILKEIKREKIELGLNDMNPNYGNLDGKSSKQHNTFDFNLLNSQQANPIDINNMNYSNQIQQSYLNNQQYAYSSYKM